MTKIREGYKETEIGVIPEDWEVTRICDVASFISNGFVGTASPYYSDDKDATLYLMGNNVRENYIDKRTLVRINNEFTKNYPKSRIFYGDMLTVQSGHIGTSCVVTKEFDNAHCHAVIITRFDRLRVNSDYQAYYINSSQGKSRLKSLFVGTTIKHINTKDLKVFKIPLPPLQEQQRIAEILSTTDSHIEKLDKIIEDYQLLKKGMMKKLLTEGIGHTEFKETEIGRIPKEWEVVQVVNTYDKQTKGLYEKLKSNQYKDIGNYPIIDQGQSFICGYIDEIDKLFKGELPVIVFGDHTRIIKFIDFPFAVGADGTQLLKAKKIFDDRFYYYSLCNLNLVNQGYSRHFKYLNESFIALPSKEEQVSIAKILSKFDENVMLFSKQRESYFDLKKALMEKLLTGKIRVDTGLLKGDSSPSFSMDGMVGQIIKNVK